MRYPIHGTSSRFRLWFQVYLAMIIGGVVILGGGTWSAEEPVKKKASRKTPAAKAFRLPPLQNNAPDVIGAKPLKAFIPNSQASDEELDLQKEVARVLCSQAKPYPGREEHFNWLANDPLFQKAVFEVYGLSGYILEAESLPGGWRARVSVRPVVQAAGRAEIVDYILEDYLYQNGVLSLIRTDAAIPKTDKQVLRLF